MDDQAILAYSKERPDNIENLPLLLSFPIDTE
jgi:hypothetical protein